MKKYLFTFLIFLFATDFAFNQPLQFNFQNYSTNEGLCSSNIIGTFKDSRGFLWIRTLNGLSRYDGIAFENFFYSAKDSNSVAANTIYSLCEMPHDLILIGTTNGLSVFNNAKHCFENWRIKASDLKRGTNSIVSALIVDQNKNLWINYNGNLDVYDSLLQFKFRYTETASGKILKGILTGQNGYSTEQSDVLWMQNINHGLAKINLKTLAATCYRNSESELYHNHPIRAIYYDKQNQKLYYSPWGMGLYCYDETTNTFEYYKFPLKNTFDQTYLNTINKIVPLKNNLLCATENGLLIFDKSTHQYSVLKSRKNTAFSLPASDLNYIQITNDSLLWVSTYNGIAKCKLKETQFKFLSNEFKDNEKEVPIEINHFDIYKSEWIILGTVDNGIYAYNLNTHKQQHYLNLKAKNVYDNLYSKIYVDRQNNIWVATYYGLRLYHPETNTVSLPPPGMRTISTSASLIMMQDSHLDYWIAYEGDTSLVHAINLGNGKYQIKNYRVAEDNFPLYKINRIQEDSDSNIWIVTDWALGFLKWDRGTNSFMRYPKVKSTSEYLSESNRDLLVASPNVIWLASGASHGLIKYDPIANKEIYFTTEDGLIDNNLVAMYKHTDKSIWIATENGLSQFNPSTNKFTNYSTADGLPETSFTRKIVYDSVSKNLFTITPHYVIYFNPDDLKKQINPIDSSKIYLQKMQVNGTDRFVDFSKPLTLTHLENSINFEFSYINFKDGAKTIFGYQLEGLEDKWNNSGNRRFVNYTNLSSGTYHFKARVSKGDDIWSAEKTIATIVISKPFYFRWWFILLAVATVTGIIYVVYDYRKRNRRALEKVRERISRDLHDEIGSTLNSISIYSEIAKLKNTEEVQRDKFLETIGNSSRDMIEQMNDIVWTVNPMNDKFENILMRMRSFASEITDGKLIQLEFDVDENCKNIALEMNERKSFYLIFKEALNNAMKYSKSTQVKVNIKLKDQMLILMVKDNGVGFETSTKLAEKEQPTKGGNGLRNMKARADEIKADLKIDSSNSNGTQVTLKMKV